MQNHNIQHITICKNNILYLKLKIISNLRKVFTHHRVFNDTKANLPFL